MLLAAGLVALGGYLFNFVEVRDFCFQQTPFIFARNIKNNIHPNISFLKMLYCNFLKGRSSRWEMFSKKGILKNFSKFTGKHMCWSLFFNKLY